MRVQVRGPAQLVFRRLRGLKCGDGGGRSDDARGALRPSRPLRRERAAETVRDRAGSTTGAGNVDGVPRRGGIQLRFRRPAGFGELRVVPAADARDELAGRHRLGALCDRFLQLGDRKRSLDAARLVAGIDAGARVVDVRVEEAWNDGASTKVDRARIGASGLVLPTLAMRPFRIVSVVPTCPRPSTNFPFVRIRSRDATF